MTDRRRPMRRLGEVLPGVASSLGLEEQLRLSRAMAGWERLVQELVPAASGASSVLAADPPILVVSAASPIVAQELRFRSGELLRAFSRVPGGDGFASLRIVIRHGEAGDGRHSGSRGGTGGRGRSGGAGGTAV